MLEIRGGIVWKELFTDSSYNNAIAAGAEEVITSARGEVREHGPFNRLLLTNLSDVKIKVSLDGIDAEAGGRIFEVPRQSVLTIKPEDGVTFSFFKIKNLDAAVACADDTVHARWAKAVKVE